jgi:hypothetical protein
MAENCPPGFSVARAAILREASERNRVHASALSMLDEWLGNIRAAADAGALTDLDADLAGMLVEYVTIREAVTSGVAP